MVPVLQALAFTERQNRSQREGSWPMVEVGPYRFLLRLGQSDETPTLPRHYAGMIYHDGFNLGVVRHPQRKELDFRLLREDLPGWFIHPSGFMACWVASQPPATTLPPAGTPQTPAELVELLRKHFGSIAPREPQE